MTADADPRRRDRRSPGLDALELDRPSPADSGRRRCWSAAVAEAAGRRPSCSGFWQVVVWTRLEARVRPARPGDRCSRSCGTTSPTASCCDATRDHAAAGGRSGFARRRSSSAPSLGVARRPQSRSCAPAVGSLITGLQTMPSIAWFPLAILLFKLTRGGDLLRGRARRGAVDRQRPHQRHRPHPAGPAPGRARRSAPSGSRCCAPRDPAGRAAGVRRRPQAGLGVRLAQPDGRRADRDHRRNKPLGSAARDRPQNSDVPPA